MRGPALIALAVAVLAAGCTDESDAVPVRAPGWETFDALRHLGPKTTMVWTGDELAVWDGVGSDTDGALFDPARDEWRDIPNGPLRARVRPAAAWTGDEFVLWGGTVGSTALDDGAAFNPGTGTWRTLPAAPITARIPVAGIWTGNEFVVWGDAARAEGTRDGAAYDPGRDRWQRIADAPFALNQATAVWSGDEIIVVGAALDDRNEAADGAQAMAYDPAADRWRTLPEPPLSPQASTAAWVDGRLVAWDYGLAAAVYEPDENRWANVAGPPLTPSECYPSSAATSDTVVGWYCGIGALYKAGAWSKLYGPSGVDERPVAGRNLVFFTRNGDLEAFEP